MDSICNRILWKSLATFFKLTDRQTNGQGTDPVWLTFFLLSNNKIIEQSLTYLQKNER